MSPEICPMHREGCPAWRAIAIDDYAAEVRELELIESALEGYGS
jgi:hypothetical protein